MGNARTPKDSPGRKAQASAQGVCTDTLEDPTAKQAQVLCADKTLVGTPRKSSAYYTRVARVFSPARSPVKSRTARVYQPAASMTVNTNSLVTGTPAKLNWARYVPSLARGAPPSGVEQPCT